jgi:hypothetical protein
LCTPKKAIRLNANKMTSRRRAGDEAQARVARVTFVPANVVKDTRRSCLLLLFQLCIQLVIREVNELAMIRQFLHVVVHRSDVTAEQLIDAPVYLIL